MTSDVHAFRPSAQSCCQTPLDLTKTSTRGRSSQPRNLAHVDGARPRWPAEHRGEDDRRRARLSFCAADECAHQRLVRPSSPASLPEARKMQCVHQSGRSQAVERGVRCLPASPAEPRASPDLSHRYRRSLVSLASLSGKPPLMRTVASFSCSRKRCFPLAFPMASLCVRSHP